LAYTLKVSSIPTLREQVVTRLRDAIAHGHFAPGERLRERVLCELMGVSRTSLREALRELESEGLVVSVANRGIMVAPIDTALAVSMFELREALEVLAVTSFVRHADAVRQAALTAAFEGMRRAYGSGDPALVLESKRAYYDAIVEGAANPMLRPMLRTIHVRVSQLRAASLSQPSRLAESLREFGDMYDAMHRRDAKAAQRACREHVRNAANAALASLAVRKAQQATAVA
jgi:DNA-binding GntR family transcriptional regulator